MHPVLFHVPFINWPIHTYGFMIALGFLVCMFFVLRDCKKAGMDTAVIGEHAFYALFIGLAGARIFHIIMYSENYSWSDPIGWFALWRGGLVFQGAIPFAFLYAYLVLRHFKISFLQLGDIALNYMPLAHAFGRIGCLCYGCCFGIRADALPWAIRFPQGSPAYSAHIHQYADFPASSQWSLPIHPTQIYSVIGLLCITVIIWLLRRYWRPFAGFVMPTYFMLYGVLRFIVEMYRGDGNPTNWGAGVLTNQQVFSLLLLAGGAALFAFLWRRDKRLEAEGKALPSPEPAGLFWRAPRQQDDAPDKKAEAN